MLDEILVKRREIFRDYLHQPGADTPEGAATGAGGLPLWSSPASKRLWWLRSGSVRPEQLPQTDPEHVSKSLQHINAGIHRRPLDPRNMRRVHHGVPRESFD